MKKEFLKRAIDLKGVMEHEGFQEAFCDGCMFRGCDLDGPFDRECSRHWYWGMIEDALDSAQGEVVDLMVAAGA